MPDAATPPLSGTETLSRGLEPLRLGDALRIEGGPVPDAEVDVHTAWRTVRLGPEGIRLLVDWLITWLDAKPYDSETPELWTASGIAQEEGVSRRAVYLWLEHDDFPEPFATPVGGAPIWEASRVRAWVTKRRAYRGPGRPLKS